VIGRPVHHLGYRVGDLERAIHAAVATFGAGPFHVIDPVVLQDAEYLGRPARVEQAAAFGQWGDLAVELFELRETEPAELGRRLGRVDDGVSHVSWVVDDLAAESERLEGLGLTCFHRASSGPVSVAWHDGGVLGHAIELHRANDALTGMFARVAESARGWDGSEPVRRAGA
jgi:methylmalonyl-CoA/ethylmalonyl-CoA epimerase